MNKIPKKLGELGYVKVASVAPILKVGNSEENCIEIIRVAKEAYENGARIIVFPELCITGYTCADLFHQKVLWGQAISGLKKIMDETKQLEALIFVGMPLVHDGMIFNVTAVLNKGDLIGLVPKTSIPGYKEFYEERWFASARDLTSKEINIFGKNVPIGTDIFFKHKDLPSCVIAAEICEDLWTPTPPSSLYSVAGATIIVNLSASNELVGKAKYRRDLVVTQSARNVGAYIYASCGVNESTTDVVFGGHCLIAENGNLLSETKRFSRQSEIIYGDIDLDILIMDRVKTTSFSESVKSSPARSYRIIDVVIADTDLEKFERNVSSSPFVPKNEIAKKESAEEIIQIQIAALAKRMEQTGIQKIILGLSGGLDSTLAFLIAKKSFELLKIPLKNIICITMPGLATTERTKSNAWKLAKVVGTTIEEIPINDGVKQQFKDLGHDGITEDITYENTQARYRTMILMNKANQYNGLVLGTGDLSEIALGWCTFSGDHLSHYNVNASVPKTLVRHLVTHVAELSDSALSEVLMDIVNTPVSPELKQGGSKEIGQKTEDIIGPYELHDFFLYYFIRFGTAPNKILWLTKYAFGDLYEVEEIKKWLTLFIKRFFRNQWKRSVMPDGPKVGSVALSPRGDWRMPSDAEVDEWLNNLPD